MRSLIIAASLFAFSMPALACSQAEMLEKQQKLAVAMQEFSKNPDAMAGLQQKLASTQGDAMALAQDVQKDPSLATKPEFQKRTCDLMDKQLGILGVK